MAIPRLSGIPGSRALRSIWAIERPLGILDQQLSDRAQLLGGDFTIVDLNVASVLSMSALVGFEGVAEHPRAAAWFEAAIGRDSFARASHAGE